MWPTTGREIVEQFRHGLHERINAGISRSERLHLITRACKWCGTRFQPLTVSDHFCSAECRRVY